MLRYTSSVVCAWRVVTDQRRLEVHSSGTRPPVPVAVYYRLYCRYARHHIPGAYNLRRTTVDSGLKPKRWRQLAVTEPHVLCLHCLHHLHSTRRCTTMSCLAASAAARANGARTTATQLQQEFLQLLQRISLQVFSDV